MKRSVYAAMMWLSLMALGTISCGKSAQQQAEEARRDSIDSVHRVDSVYAAQTQEMLALDTFIDRRMDSIHSPQKYAPTPDIDKDASPFVHRVMTAYIMALNRGENVSSVIAGDATNKVLSRLTDINGGPSKARDDEGNPIRYTLKSVKEERDHWFRVTYTRADEPITVRLQVAMNGPKKLRIESIE
ncbi:MAG: hypothetical protein ACI30R_01210 [Sodaliphilus sp.]